MKFLALVGAALGGARCARALLLASMVAVAVGCGGSDEAPTPSESAAREAPDLCDDAEDNDGDGFVDCEDLDCRAESEDCPFAPPLDRALPTTIVSANEFLYQGDDPVQKDVDPDDIEKKRFSIVKGVVIDRDGEPLGDVRVSIKDHPEFGYTLTRFDGRYDMVVNGGGNLVVRYELEGHLGVERIATTNWLDFQILPDVGMVPRSTLQKRVAPAFTASAEAEPVEDEYGKRQPVLVFQPNTRATAILPGGEEQELNAFELSITEYPYDEPEQRLPGQSKRFTPGSRFDDNSLHYSIDFSVAEAEQLGAERVEFSKPVALYVENFLELPVGLPVRTEYYDTRTSSWEVEFTGRVIEVVGIDEGEAEIDADGDGEPESGAALEELGVFDEELTELAQRYEEGDTLWRTQVDHFSAFTVAWEQLAGSVFVPNELPKVLRQHVEQPAKRGAVQIENLAVREGVGLIGTPFNLMYQTDRALGYGAAFELDIPLLGNTTPSRLRRIYVVVEVGEERIDDTIYSAPFPREHKVVWDGKVPVNLEGEDPTPESDRRLLQGQQKTKISIGYGFQGQPGNPNLDEVMEAMEGPSVVDPDRPDTVIWRKHVTWLGVFDARGMQFGGFGLDAHHSYDPVNEILYYGYGEQRSADNALLVALSLSQSDVEVFSPIEFPDSIVVGADNTLFITDDAEEPKVWRVTEDGQHDVILGAGAAGEAGEVELVSPQGIALDTRDESLFLVDYELKKLLKLDANGQLETLVGPVSSGARIEKDLEGPDGVAISPDGEVFFADYSTVFRISGDEIVPFAGHEPDLVVPSNPGETFEARRIEFDEASGVAFDADSNLYVSSRRTHVVYKIDRAGTAMVLAGTGQEGFSGDGDFGFNAQLDNPRGIAVRADKTIFIADQDNLRIRRVDQSGIIMTLAGGGDLDPVVPQPATDSHITRPDGLAFGPDSTLYTGAASEDIERPSRLIKIFNAAPFAFATDNYFIPSNDGSTVFQFNEDGRHVDTRDAMMGVVHFEFGYNASNLLTSVKDLDDLETEISRDGEGQATSIVGPFGHETRLRYDDRGALQRVSNDIRSIELTYHDENGLIDLASEAEGLNRSYEFDGKGRVKKVKGPNGYEENYVPSIGANVHVVAVSPPNGHELTYELNRGGGSIVNAMTFSDGDNVVSEGEENQWGSFHQSLPGGQQVSGALTPLMPWGGQVRYLIDYTLTTASGKSLTSETQPSMSPGIEFDDFGTYNDPFQFEEYQVTTYVNDHDYVKIFSKNARTLTTRSPAGRETVVTLNAKGRPERVQTPGVAPVFYEYDGMGRVTSVRQSDGERERTTSYEYGTNGLLSKMANTLNEQIGFGYDPEDAFRLVKVTRADGQDVSWRLDSSNNVLGMKPAGRPEHVFRYENGERLTDYFPASGMDDQLRLEDPEWESDRLGGGAGDFSLGEIRYEYDSDNRLEKLSFSDDRSIEIGYTFGDRVQRVRYTHGGAQTRTIAFGYNGDFSEVTSITAPDGSLSFVYDSPLLTETRWSGQVNGRVRYTHDDYFRPDSIRVNNEAAIPLAYDKDSMLIAAGDLTLNRDAASGLIAGTSLGSIDTQRHYDSFGELEETFALHLATVLLNQKIERDALGRIVHITEFRHTGAIGDDEPSEIVTEYDFEYDDLGRLVEASIGDSTTIYEYDANGNRISETRDGVELISRVNFDDRLEGHGSDDYEYSAAGDLLRRDMGDAAFVYEYDVLGNLLTVSHERAGEDSDEISYLADGLGRRIGRRLNGSLTHGWLYRDQLNPVAEISANGAVTQFVYGDQPNVPAYMIRGDETYRIITDHIGSVRVVVDALTGAVVQEMDYDAFGRVLRDTNEGFQPFGFAGGLYDPATGLVKFGVRDYDAQTGRFLTKDSIGLGGGMNGFSYAGNDPVNLVDPTGHWIDTVVDIGFIAYDIYRLATDGPEKLEENLIALGADVAGALIPGATGLGALTRAGKAGTKLFAKNADNGATLLVNHGDDVLRHGNKGDNGARVLWSGSREAQQEAAEYALKTGAKTLEMTRTGKVLAKLSKKVPYPIMRPLWDIASRRFVRGAKGPVHVFHSAQGVKIKSVWRRVEYKELVKMGNEIIYHIAR